jgi:hypothetical protein
MGRFHLSLFQTPSDFDWMSELHPANSVCLLQHEQERKTTQQGERSGIANVTIAKTKRTELRS